MGNGEHPCRDHGEKIARCETNISHNSASLASQESSIRSLYHKTGELRDGLTRVEGKVSDMEKDVTEINAAIQSAMKRMLYLAATAITTTVGSILTAVVIWWFTRPT